MRIGHFFTALQYYNQERNRETRDISELFRIQTAFLVNIQLKESDRMSPEQMWKFPWDNEEEQAELMTDEEIERHNLEMIERINGRRSNIES